MGKDKYIVDGFHGDPDRDNYFWVYPQGMPAMTPRWDTYLPGEKFCMRGKLILKYDDGREEWQCSGHGKIVDDFHGDASREHKFWVYPKETEAQTAQWDTHEKAYDFCSRALKVSDLWGGIEEWKCQGHKDEHIDDGYHGDSFRDH